MLKTKTIFTLLFVALFAVFAVSVSLLIRSNIDTLLFKQYEQKLKTLDDTLRFSLLKDLNSSTIKDFAKETRADFIISHKNNAFSSLQNELLGDFTQNFTQNSPDILKSTLKGREILYKAYKFEDFTYIIIVYPRILELKGYWSKIFLIFAVCILLFFALLQIFANKLKENFSKILIFLDKIDNKDSIKLNSSIFKELTLLNSKLYSTKTELLKRQKQNKKQNDKIALKNTQLSSVISALSHELKNPLSVINLSLETLKEPTTPQEIKLTMLEKIRNQSYKLDKLADKLNLVFNLNCQALQKSEFELFSLCEQIIKNPSFERVKIQGEACKVSADAFLIEQVIINLLNNALKYSQKEVILSITPILNGVKVSVKDYGIGIEQNELKFITKKFYKINTKSENSFGIGLFLVKKILALHSSHLQIQSTLGEGSEFSFILA